jgi:hypothetical protein
MSDSFNNHHRYPSYHYPYEETPSPSKVNTHHYCHSSSYHPSAPRHPAPPQDDQQYRYGSSYYYPRGAELSTPSQLNDRYHQRWYYYPPDEEFASGDHQFQDVFTPFAASKYCEAVEEEGLETYAPLPIQPSLTQSNIRENTLPSTLTERASPTYSSPSRVTNVAVSSSSEVPPLELEKIWACESGDTFACPFDYYERVLEHAKTCGFTIARSFERYWEEDQEKFGVVVKKGYIYCNVLKCQRGRRGCCFGIRFVHVQKQGVYKINKCNGTHLHDLCVGPHNNGRRRAPVVTPKASKRLKASLRADGRAGTSTSMYASAMRNDEEAFHSEMSSAVPDKNPSCIPGPCIVGRSSFYA